MKKIYFSLILLIFIIFFINFNINNKNNESQLQVIKVAEVAHTIFYAPQYVAINKGFFEEEGLEIDLILASGADSVMASVLSNEVDIGLSGAEATIYVYNQGLEDYVQTFAGLTNKDGSFIVGREFQENFTLEDLKSSVVMGGRIGGMPLMTFEWILKQNNIDIENDLTIDTSIAFAAMGGTFISGVGDYDYVTLFEPIATQVENLGFGYVLESVGFLGGNLPYTAYNARKSFIDNNLDIIEKFNNAINKGLEYMKNNESSIIAGDIISFFPDTSIDDMIKIIDRYKSIDAWKNNTTISEEEFILLQDIMINSGEILEYVSYDDLIYTELFDK